jgi:hypothetical protein
LHFGPPAMIFPVEIHGKNSHNCITNYAFLLIITDALRLD